MPPRIEGLNVEVIKALAQIDIPSGMMCEFPSISLLMWNTKMVCGLGEAGPF